MRLHLMVGVGRTEKETLGKFQIRDTGHRAEDSAAWAVVSNDVGISGMRARQESAFSHGQEVMGCGGLNDRTRTMKSLRTPISLTLLALCGIAIAQAAPKRPNLIFILSDDIAQGDIGAYGQKLIRTPNLDRLCSQGTRYLSAYCGTTVCAPSRTSFFTGLHMGHSPVRANREVKPEGQRPLPADIVNVGKLMKSAGYATATMGKWGMGMFDTTGSPLKNGIDRFYGYNCQRHAHSYFPTYLYDNDKRIEIPENAGGKRGAYAQDLIQKEVLRWVDAQGENPFFLFYAITLPHGSFEIDDLGEYADKPWSDLEKTYAAMVTRLDSDVGGLVSLLEKKGIADNTLIVFAGDNGSSFGADSPIGRRFNQSMDGKLRGFKRGMYEGALRQASFAWWPGTVPAGRVTDEPWAFWDILPTFAELAGAELPTDFKPDGHSLTAFLKGGPAPKRDHFYWELHEGQSIQALRWGNWKAVRPKQGEPLELYDLTADLSEKANLADKHPNLVADAERMIREARTPDPDWPDPAEKKAKGTKNKR